MKRIISILLCTLIILTACSTSVPLVSAYTVEYEQETFGYRDLQELEDRIAQQTDRMDAAHAMAEAARALDFTDDSEVIQIAKVEYNAANARRSNYQDIYNDLNERWQAKADEYPVATYVWETLADAGYSDVAIAGIIGNMMAEVGGHTLNLEWWLTTPSYYGLCQWSHAYSEVWGAGLEDQCKFLLSTIKYELDEYGYMYKRGYHYDDFLEMTDVQAAALFFAKSYERCGSSTHGIRQKFAVQAYNYFVA